MYTLLDCTYCTFLATRPTYPSEYRLQFVFCLTTVHWLLRSCCCCCSSSSSLIWVFSVLWGVVLCWFCSSSTLWLASKWRVLRCYRDTVGLVRSAPLHCDTFIVGSAIINPQSYHSRNQISEQEEWTSIGFALQTNRWGVGGNSVQCPVRPFVRFGHSSISESTSASGMSSIFMGWMCCRGTFILVLPRSVVVCIRSVIWRLVPIWARATRREHNVRQQPEEERLEWDFGKVRRITA